MKQKEHRWKEFFQVNGEYSMRNLTVFITIIVGSLVVLWCAHDASISAELFAVYLLAGGGVYSFGKWQDDKTRRSEIEVDATPTNTAPKAGE